MDLGFNDDYTAFRTGVRDFLRQFWTEKRDAHFVADFRRKATQAGFLYRSIPRAYGGSEQPADLLAAMIIKQEFDAARAPMEVGGNGMSMLIPTLLEHGTETQKLRFIPPTVAGELRWAQGYSEPGSGSDLASLRTYADLRGDRWIISGQKIWSSDADRCDYMYALVRTTPGSHRHAGITYILIDLRQPGITVRPIKAINGENRFCEVFFDEAEAPLDWTVGPIGDGWRVSKSTLKHERISIGGIDRVPFDQLLSLARKTQKNGQPAIENPDMRQRLAAIDGALKALTYSGYRQISMRALGEEPGLIDLVSKLVLTNILHDVSALAHSLIGDQALLAAPTSGVRGGAEKWNNQFLGSLGTAIAGGTSNIQRNIISERGLGLPRSDDGNG
jgi:alkylation response protein AidB-like acyl-CoA dehydrogenase